MNEARITLRIDGEDYLVHPGTFQEGAIRRQPEVITLQDVDLKSVPDTRQFWQTSWLGGAQWEQPVYSLQNLDTYHEARNLSMTDRGGAAREARLYELATTKLTPRTHITAWSRNSFDGAVGLDFRLSSFRWVWWDSSTDTWNYTDAIYGSSYNIAAMSGGTGDLVYAIADDGTLLTWDTSGSTTSTVSTGLSIYSGTSLWVDPEWVWIYNGDRLYRLDIDDSYNVEEASGVVNDGDGVDVFSTDADFTGTPIISEWNTPRAINTSEGIFYVKNIYEGGQPVAKVYRVDRDASGTYINTPVTTLPKGQLAISLAMHMSSLIVSTVGNYFTAFDNDEHQPVQLYHITGNSVGMIGQPLGGAWVNETPVWLLGTSNGMFMIGGHLRVWEYDARLGSIHQLRRESGYLTNGGAFTQMANVRTSTGTGTLYMHENVSAGAGTLLESNDTFQNAEGTAWLRSNWIDFDLPMEVKQIDEIFYDFDHIRTGQTVTVTIYDQDGNSYAAGTITDADTTGYLTPAVTITGYRFYYLLSISNDDTGSDPLELLSFGMRATAGEMVKIIQCTINGWESVNMQNSVQDPDTIYDNLATLRDNADPVSATHWMKSAKGSESATDTYKVVSVTQRREDPREGLIDVVLMGTTPSGRITEA